MTVQDVVNVLFQFAPCNLKEEWDNVGLLCGHGSAEVHKVLVALDPTIGVLREAAAIGCDMVISHHPVLFGSISAVSDCSPTGAALLFAAERGIACVNLHTNLDCVSGGVNDVLAERLSLQDCKLLAPRGCDEKGSEYGYSRHGSVVPCTLTSFLEHVKTRLGCKSLRYVNGGREVHHVAVAGGACADELYAAAAAGCDTFVTADVKYHQFLDAATLGVSLIDAGHFETENPICDVICRKLKQALPSIDVCLSKTHTDTIDFY